jgi:hypothetical protein
MKKIFRGKKHPSFFPKKIKMETRLIDLTYHRASEDYHKLLLPMKIPESNWSAYETIDVWIFASKLYPARISQNIVTTNMCSEMWKQMSGPGFQEKWVLLSIVLVKNLCPFYNSTDLAESAYKLYRLIIDNMIFRSIQ